MDASTGILALRLLVGLISESHWLGVGEKEKNKVRAFPPLFLYLFIYRNRRLSLYRNSLSEFQDLLPLLAP